ncbi:ATP-dependent RNA helicase [Chrysochromulina tobinii]|uniref:ATP-dependent RNA helicase n=1 Tax=Chrysochromulina tobinii TaxID=1460289 RepID=A0A0M0JLY1_9EUKA|nr:ATP-dependent RNA helicase [Chrysochromulina tobinii]|eukprot:KOO27278.1 ATP-dependent RNA helicase [Chrysochromulina sp. CCMP291]
MSKRALARGPSVEDDDSSDDEPVAKKKKQNKQLVAPPEKIGSMRPAAWTQQRLTATPIRKNVWEGELPEPAVDEEAVDGVRAEALYGGEPREEQAEAMEGAFHVLVATAGRCTDMLSSGHVSLARVGCLVLDEADQLLTLGFSVQVSQVLSQIRPDRQMLLFSATLSERLETVVGKWFTKPPLRIYADEAVNMNGSRSNELCGLLAELGHTVSAEGSGFEELGAGPFASQRSAVMGTIDGVGQRGGLKGHLLKGHYTSSATAAAVGAALGGPRRNAPRVMVFVNEIAMLRKLAIRLRKRAVKCEVLHGELSQREREEALQQFKAGARPVLLTSDLAARGLDIARLPAIVNYDVPPSTASYLHRAGRTGRKGAPGLVVTFVRRDVPSRHFATQSRALFKRAGLPIPEALRSLLRKPVDAAQRTPRKPVDGDAGLAGASLLDFAAMAAVPREPCEIGA